MKNIRVVFFVMVAIAFSIFSTVCFAEPMVIESEIELRCGSASDYHSVPEVSREGDPYVQFFVEIIGIREIGIEDIIDVVKVDNVRKGKKRMAGGSELPVKISVSCFPLGSANFISLTGESFECNKGDGVRLKLLRPNSENPDEFHAVLKLTTVIYDDSLEETTEPEKPEIASELAIESEPQVVSQLELLNQRWEEVRGFLEGKGYSARAIDVFHLQVNQGRQQELNSEIESLDREIQELEAQQIVLQSPTQTGGPPQPTPINRSGLGVLNLGFSGSG